VGVTKFVSDKIKLKTIKMKQGLKSTFKGFSKDGNQADGTIVG
jgi:hypothetical protein